MQEHFAELFERYETLATQHVAQPAARLDVAVGDRNPELAIACSLSNGG